MNKKNHYIRTILILLCLTAAPSFYLLSSSYTPRIPAGKRPRAYTGPRNIRQKSTPRPVAQTESDQSVENIPASITTPVPVNQPRQNIEQSQPEPTVTSQSMPAKAQASAASPGWLMTAYIVFLSTLNKAFGVGLEQSYKPLSEDYRQRQVFLNLRNEAQKQAKKTVESGEFDNNVYEMANKIIKKNNLSKEDPQYQALMQDVKDNINLPAQQKMDLTAENILKKKIIDPEQMEKETSFGSMASKSIYFGLFNTATRLAGGLIGFGATMLLQSLMPTQNE